MLVRPDTPKVLALGIAVLAGCSSPGQEEPGPGYVVRDGVVQDTAGQVLFLRGINVHESAKYHPDRLIPLTPEEVATLPAGGFNSVRLLAAWDAIMPGRDRVDAGYLDRYVAEVDKLTAAGLYVVVDMHQDLWGPPFGNGAPSWACPDEIKEGYEPQSPWWLNYFSDQVTGCFDLFWGDRGLQDEYAAAWSQLAAEVCGNPRVVGFDLMNEPWPASALGEPGFDQEVLYPFYRRVMAEVELACPGRVFFLEPSRAYDFGLTGPLDIAPDDRQRVVVAPHFYPPAVHEPGEGYDGDAVTLEADLESLYRWYDDLGVPLWFGEYGGVTGNPNFDAYMTDVTGILYRRNWGSALWAFSLGDGGFSYLDATGNPKAEFARAGSLPVPTRLPSVPELVPDFDARSLSLGITCLPGLELAVLMPGGSWSFTAAPDGVLSAPEEGEPFWTAGCLSTGTVQVEIAATD